MVGDFYCQRNAFIELIYHGNSFTWKVQNQLSTMYLIFHVSFNFLVLLFWTFLVSFSGPPTPCCQKQ